MRPGTRSAVRIASAAILATVLVSLADLKGSAAPVSAGSTIVLTVSARDVIYDPYRDLLYASVAGTDAIVPMDPHTGAFGTAIAVGSAPNKLAISDDAQYLYVGVDGVPGISRVELATMTVDLQFSLGSGMWGEFLAEDIEVLPGSPESVAVSRRNVGFSPRHEGVAVYDNGVPRDVATPRHTGSNVIEFAGSTLYGYNSESTEFGFREMAIDAQGVSVTSVTQRLITGFSVDTKAAAGLIYSTAGRVVDPVSKTLVGSYAATGPVEPDPSLGRTFYLRSMGSSRVLEVFDLDKFTLLASSTLSGVSGTPLGLHRWGSDGLAVHTSTHLTLIRSPLVDQPIPAAPLPEPESVGTGMVRLNFGAADLAYDPHSDRIYASIGGRTGASGNSIYSITTDGHIDGVFWVGSDPGKITISEDGQYLYVGLNGSGAVRRFHIPSQSLDILFP